MFSQFLSNLVIKNVDTISLRYGEIAAALNKRFRDTESRAGWGHVAALSSPVASGDHCYVALAKLLRAVT